MLHELGRLLANGAWQAAATKDTVFGARTRQVVLVTDGLSGVCPVAGVHAAAVQDATNADLRLTRLPGNSFEVPAVGNSSTTPTAAGLDAKQ